MAMTKEDVEGQLQQRDDTVIGFGNARGFELMQRAAKLLSASTLVPKDYQGNLANCVVALNMANRIDADPLMVMQNLYVVHGRPGWSSQFLIASFNQCGRFSAIRFEFFGERNTDSWGCRAWAIERSTNERIVGSDITIALSKKEGWYNKSGSKWQSMPQQMLMYRSAAWLVRAYAPEISMGLQTTEELRDVIDVTPVTVDSSTGEWIKASSLADKLKSKKPNPETDKPWAPTPEEAAAIKAAEEAEAARVDVT